MRMIGMLDRVWDPQHSVTSGPGCYVLIRRLALILVVLLVWVAGVVAVLAQSSVPYNGNFDVGIQGWSLGGLDCGWDDVNGYPSAGSLRVVSGCVGTSQAFTTSAAWALSLYCATTDVSGTLQVRWRVPGGSTGSWNDWCSGSSAWEYWEGQSFGSSGSFVVEVTGSGPGSMYVDTVLVSGGSASGVTPTSLPGTPSPTGVSGTVAAARVTVSAVTPAYDSASAVGQLPYLTGTDPDLSNAVRVQGGQAVWSFCLPSEVQALFPGVNLCVEFPVFSFVTFVWLGIDMTPYLSGIAVVLFIVFVIRQVQEK